MAAGAVAFELLTYEQALEQAVGSKHILLGNGFSRALYNDIFAYDALFLKADFTRLSNTAGEAFNVLKTTDFEKVMRTLRLIVKLLPLYRNDEDLIRTLTADADGLREVLVQAIANNHPAGTFEMSDDQAVACRTFLEPFNHIYTVNYDLLLYWALIRTELRPAVKCDDGFRAPDDPDADYVTWEVENTNSQNVFYLHGALHIFDAESELKKYTWVRTGVRLIDQIREALTANLYPMIVAEGTSEEKLAKIYHNIYLSRAYRSFANIGGNLFIFGFSFSDNDQHWFDLISRGGKSIIRRLFVGLYGNAESEGNRTIRAKALQIAAQRDERHPLEVKFFDAVSAQVWG